MPTVVMQYPSFVALAKAHDRGALSEGAATEVDGMRLTVGPKLPHPNRSGSWCLVLVAVESGDQIVIELGQKSPGKLVDPPAAPPAARPRRTLPDDSADRKGYPLAEGCLFYFPAALAEVARISKIGNDKHNPGQPMHHARGKSMDHADCVLRHMIDARESEGPERTEHLANLAWRALAQLQEHCEAMGAPLAPNAKEPT